MSPKKSANSDQELLQAVLAVVPVNTPTKTTVRQMAELIGVPHYRIHRLRAVLHALGVMETRFVGVMTGQRHPRTGKPTLAGRNTEWTITADEAEIKRRMKEGGWDFGIASEVRANSMKPGKTLWTKVSEQPAPKPEPTHPEPTQVKPRGEEVPQPVAKPAEDNPFSALRSLRKDEPRALIEAARQYAQRSSFIEEKMSEFQKMGLRIDPSAIQFDRDERLEHIGLVADYVARLERENERMSSIVSAKTGESSELRDLRDRVRKQTEQIERLVQEKGDAREYIDRITAEHRKEMQTKEREIDRLQEERLQLRRQINGESTAQAARPA